MNTPPLWFHIERSWRYIADMGIWWVYKSIGEFIMWSPISDGVHKINEQIDPRPQFLMLGQPSIKGWNKACDDQNEQLTCYNKVCCLHLPPSCHAQLPIRHSLRHVSIDIHWDQLHIWIQPLMQAFDPRSRYQRLGSLESFLMFHYILHIHLRCNSLTSKVDREARFS